MAYVQVIVDILLGKEGWLTAFWAYIAIIAPPMLIAELWGNFRHRRFARKLSRRLSPRNLTVIDHVEGVIVIVGAPGPQGPDGDKGPDGIRDTEQTRKENK
jgi:hypothetical protein